MDLQLLWTYMTWEAGHYQQAGYYRTREDAEEARAEESPNWGEPSPVYSVTRPWAD